MDSADHNNKRKRAPDPPLAYGQIYSQPADTSSGTDWRTRLIHALDYLKEKEKPMAYKDIWDFLSIPNASNDDRNFFKKVLSRSEKIHVEPDAFGPGKSSWRFRPKHDVRGPEDLLNFLQQQKTAQGVKAADLKDGWAGAEKAIEDLGAEHQVLVNRTKKDKASAGELGAARSVWADDPTLYHPVDDEFKAMWGQVKLPPSQSELRSALISFGLQPTSQVKAPIKTQEKKKKKVQRRGGKTTNTHMAGILKDYSHMRR